MRTITRVALVMLAILIASSWATAQDCIGTGQGCLDPSFGGGWVVTDVSPYKASSINDVAIQNFEQGQKIVAVGQSYSMWTMARYNSDGTLDPCFGDPVHCNQGIVQMVYSPTIAVVGISAVAVQADNTLVVAGIITGKNNFKFAIARYTADGLVDSTFGNNGIVLVPSDPKVTAESVGYGVTLQPDGKIVAVGTYKGDLAVVRLNPEHGTYDGSFASGGMFIASSAYSCTSLGPGENIAIDNAKRIVVAGSIVLPAPKGSRGQPAPPNPRRNCVLRLTPDGKLDTTFGAGGMTTTEFFGTEQLPYGGIFKGVAIDAANRIVAVGEAKMDTPWYARRQLALARYDVNGALDGSFNGTGKLTRDTDDADALGTQGFACAIQADSKIRALSQYGPVTIWRFNSDGTTDYTFGSSGLGFVESDVENGAGGAAMTQQTASTFIVAGSANVNGTAKFALARYFE